MVKNFLSKMKFRWACWKYEICPRHHTLKTKASWSYYYHCTDCLEEEYEDDNRRKEQLELARKQCLDKIKKYDD